MRIRRTAIAVAAVAAGVMSVPAIAIGHGGYGGGPDAVGLAGSTLVKLDTERPERAKKIGTVKGLVGDATLVGIDRRVQNGKLYGVGDKGGIYTISDRSAKVTKVGQLSVALDGTSFGVDFNPAANALRIVSNTGQNLRQPFGTTDGPTVATVADGTLNYLGVTAPGISAGAYTNNDLSADTATSLFDLDTTLDQVALQSPANSGGLAATGKLGLDAGSDAGFDIYSTVKKGKTVSNQGFAVLSVNGQHRLYTVNLLTGSVQNEGAFNAKVTDIAVDLKR